MYSVLGIAVFVQRDIAKNIYIQELWFLRSAHSLMLVNISMTFHEDILNGFQVTDYRADGIVNISMTFHEDILNGFQVTDYRADGIVFCSWHSRFSRTILREQGDYREHYVNRFRDLL